MKMSARAVISEGLTEAGGSTSKKANSQGFWQEDSASYRVDLSIGLLECPHDMAADFPRARGPERERAGISNVFYDLPSEVTHHYFCFILLVRSAPLSTVHTEGEQNKVSPLERGVAENS